MNKNKEILKLYEIWSNDYKKYDQLMWVTILSLLGSTVFAFSNFGDQVFESDPACFAFIMYYILLLSVFFKHKFHQKNILARMKKIEENETIRDYVDKNKISIGLKISNIFYLISWIGIILFTIFIIFNALRFN